MNTNKLNKTSIVNNLTANVSGSPLDATQGKILNDKINNLLSFTSIVVTANLDSMPGVGTDTITFLIGNNMISFTTRPLFVSVVAQSFQGHLVQYDYDNSNNTALRVTLKRADGGVFANGFVFRIGVLCMK